ncbi:DNA polymerase-4 [Amaricoccus macauensis]|uniref:DNA polymerase IV n=1 Tax=Amaricoccus macauensis TaxID=57001 RepID=A0A840ST68_9RHOB|nr:DNA polymerase IV [Amaricoccus macauensis]MBB5223798.1 DNA polymerase-4 [Amaricoccus macauensis]
MAFSFCRDCLTPLGTEAPRCPACRSPRLATHPELATLSIAHLDCDAFYAAVEKREDPSLRDRPLIVGGGRRGVVSTACYIARIRGVRSAMPMFRALKLCPDAVVVPPRMALYAEVSRAMRAMMLELTPLIEPLSLDEAFLDLTGTERLHRAPPSLLLARLQKRIEAELGVTASVGLSHNKFLAKIASERDKPRGFAVIGRAETDAFLATQPVSIIWGVGQAGLASLERAGIRSIADLRARDRATLVRGFGSLGDRLWHLARGEDTRSVTPDRPLKSISHEMTFDLDIADGAALARYLWQLAEKVSARAKRLDLAGRVVTLKLKRADHSTLTRRQTLDEPTVMADRLYRTALPMLQRDMSAGPFRLIGVGLASLSVAGLESGDLLSADSERRLKAERATDSIRARFGEKSIILGRSLE